MTTFSDSELLGKLIHDRRGRYGYCDAAQGMADTSPSTLNRIERGAIPSIVDLIEIADRLGVSPGIFFQSAADTNRQAVTTPADLALLSDARLRPETAQALATLVTLLVERSSR